MKFVCLLSAVLFFAASATAQSAQSPEEAAAYTNTLMQRTAKIVATLDIPDSAIAKKVQAIMVQQYRDLNTIHDTEKDDSKKTQQLRQLHEAFLTRLSAHLNQQQIDKVKDGMTYNVFHVTYTAYQEMIPALTEAQKNKIYGWLKEARELAMDQGSSNDKHKVFGKYKGRINNYLSAEGYDLKKEEKAWQERRRNSKNNG